jgi:diguanylate cyclase (GGDEF)-like protein/PAS domain S-box-containing protein
MENALLDILILGLLVLVFGSIYRKRASVRLRYWIIGWAFILLHFAVLLLNPASNFWICFDTSIILATLDLGGVAFLLAATRARMGPNKGSRIITLLCAPPLAYIFLTQYGVQNTPLLIGLILAQAAATVVATRMLWESEQRVARLNAACIALCTLWAVYEIIHGDSQAAIYPVFTQIYAINAILYWQDFRRRSMGVVTAIGGLIAWAAVFPCALLLAAWAPNLHYSGEIWNLPKYFVEFGMILTLMEGEIIATSRQREEYRLLFDNNPHPMWIFDEDSLEFLKVNEAATVHYGYSIEDFGRITLAELRPPDEVEKFKKELREIGNISLHNGPWTHIKCDGTQIKVEVASHSIKFDGHRARVSLVQDITERERLHEQLVHQANHDILTGLPNRLLLKDRMERALTTAARTGEKAAVICLDLDRFKQINDRFGHHVGDACLKHLADLLTQRLRAADTVARSGGEEFTVVLGGLQSAEDAALVAQNLVQGIRLPFEFEGYNLELSASLGIAMYPDDGAEPQSLWRAADVAMYRAKRSGGNQYLFVSNEISSAALETNELEACMRSSLKEGGFEIYYQPQYAVNGVLRGFEALLRLHHPTWGLIGPDRFIPIAEECGLIIRIGNWVLDEVCRQLAEWKRQGLPVVSVALNISPMQLMRADFSTQVRTALATHQVDPELLEIEITETTVMRELDDVAKQMEELAAVGVRFSVDDFGTGYSSLRHLHRLPISTLKIDQSFIENVCDEVDAREIVQAIISLAHILGMQVVAEGVERAEQVDMLRSLSCDQLQGFLWGKPQPASAVPALMLARRANFTIEGALSRGVASPQPHIC